MKIVRPNQDRRRTLVFINKKKKNGLPRIAFSVDHKVKIKEREKLEIFNINIKATMMLPIIGAPEQFLRTCERKQVKCRSGKIKDHQDHYSTEVSKNTL